MKGGTEMFLVKQAQRGDADAFVALIEKYKMDPDNEAVEGFFGENTQELRS